ncbi:hypothetical protein SIID45300_02765 [Candidatus Magnetaquicoccaceae bacterium FCR-1]|uniref:Uncharacterized protein n=1 Tax=Candidatus Magnetaquiglobus chichijimensis TaxID=3141448 RepID=A0ABQ0CC05_9PROT
MVNLFRLTRIDCAPIPQPGSMQGLFHAPRLNTTYPGSGRKSPLFPNNPTKNQICAENDSESARKSRKMAKRDKEHLLGSACSRAP